MAKIRSVLSALDPETKESAPHTSNDLLFRPLNITRAQSPNMLGPNTQCGSALATEIDSYRRRIQTLLHFFDCIAQHWWDHLYPYKRNLIKRPSKSADEVRSYRLRLSARLHKLTMRTIVPAASAIATMEAHANVKVLPPNFLTPLAADWAHGEIPSTIENGDALLQKACHLARRISDIEKLKQRLILSALTWVTSDGRDLTVRTQRIALLARHVEPCLIEHFDGVRALLTHYYRPRIVVQKPSDKVSSIKLNTSARVEPITAARLTSTNEEIVRAIETVYPNGQHYMSLPSTINPDKVTGTIQPFGDQGIIPTNIGRAELDTEAITSFPNLTLINQEAEKNLAGGKLPILPSIVLNPLSIDTSQLDWLSYQINQREFNLHVLNMEEPEDFAYQPTDSPNFSKAHARKMEFSDKPSRSTRIDRFDAPIWTSGTPITTPKSKETMWSTSSHESEFSDLDESPVSSVYFVSEEQTKTLDDQHSSIREVPTLKTDDEVNRISGRDHSACGEGFVSSKQLSPSHKVGINSGTNPFEEQPSTNVTSPRGEGSDLPVRGRKTEDTLKNRSTHLTSTKKTTTGKTKRRSNTKTTMNLTKRHSLDSKGTTLKVACNRLGNASGLKILPSS